MEEEKKEEKQKPFNHVLEVQNGFIDANLLFKSSFQKQKKEEVATNGKSSS
jgi:hypothetical protein